MRRRKFGHRHTGRTPCAETQRHRRRGQQAMWSWRQRFELCCYTPRRACCYQRLWKPRKDPPLEAWREHVPTNQHLHCGLLASRTASVHFCCHKPFSLWYCVMAARGTEHNCNAFLCESEFQKEIDAHSSRVTEGSLKRALFTEVWARLRRTSKGWGSIPGLVAGFHGHSQAWRIKWREGSRNPWRAVFAAGV